MHPLAEISFSCILFQPLAGSALKSLVKDLPDTLLRQYEYEDAVLRAGKHLMHSDFFKVIYTF